MLAISFHPYAGYTCQEHLEWAQKQFRRTMRIKEELLANSSDYQI